MENIVKGLKNVSAIIGVLATICGLVWVAFEFEQRTHSSEDVVEKAEKMVETFDPIKAYGEYIMDSIEEVHTQAFRLEQKILDTLYQNKLQAIDSLLRLNVRISSEARRAAQNVEEGH